MILGDRRLCHDRLVNVVLLVEEDLFVAYNRLGDVVMNVSVAAMAEDKGRAPAAFSWSVMFPVRIARPVLFPSGV